MFAIQFGATQVINSRDGKAADKVKALTGGGVDTAIEAVGVPTTLQLCQDLVADRSDWGLLTVTVLSQTDDRLPSYPKMSSSQEAQADSSVWASSLRPT